MSRSYKKSLVAKERNNKYKDCRVIPAGEITMSFFE